MRLTLLLVSLLALAVACSGGDASTPSPSSSAPIAFVRTPKPTPRPTPSPSPSPTPSPTPTPAPPALDLSASHPRQGGFLLVRLLNPPQEMLTADVLFDGGIYPMLPEADHWFSVIGLSTYIGVAYYPIEVRTAETLVSAGTLTVGDGGFQYESIELPPSSAGLLNDQAAVDQERATLAQVYAGFTPRSWSGPWIMPLPGPISNAFGLQRSINGGAYYPHSGTDIIADKGTPVAAAATGTVVLARQMYLYGNAVVVDHGAGVFSSYNHLDSIAVTEGQSVTIGDLIGFIGETGFVSGPHLHWEAIIGGVRTDPVLWTQASVDP